MSSKSRLSREEKGKAVAASPSPVKDVTARGSPLDEFSLIHRDAMRDTENLDMSQRLLVADAHRLIREGESFSDEESDKDCSSPAGSRSERGGEESSSSGAGSRSEKGGEESISSGAGSRSDDEGGDDSDSYVPMSFAATASASSGATTTQFKKAVLSLKVTPQITPEGNIILDLDIAKDSRGEVTAAGIAINTKHIRT